MVILHKMLTTGVDDKGILVPREHTKIYLHTNIKLLHTHTNTQHSNPSLLVNHLIASLPSTHCRLTSIIICTPHTPDNNNDVLLDALLRRKYLTIFCGIS